MIDFLSLFPKNLVSSYFYCLSLLFSTAAIRVFSYCFIYTTRENRFFSTTSLLHPLYPFQSMFCASFSSLLFHCICRQFGASCCRVAFSLLNCKHGIPLHHEAQSFWKIPGKMIRPLLRWTLSFSLNTNHNFDSTLFFLSFSFFVKAKINRDFVELPTKWKVQYHHHHHQHEAFKFSSTRLLTNVCKRFLRNSLKKFIAGNFVTNTI